MKFEISPFSTLPPEDALGVWPFSTAAAGGSYLYARATGSSEQDAVAYALDKTPPPGAGGAAVPPFVEVKDGAGDTFRVKKTGVIEVVTGSSKGKVFSSPSSVYTAVLANLAAVGNNAATLATVVDAREIIAAVEAKKKQPPTAISPADTVVVTPKESLTSKAWFWPAVIGVSTVGIGAAIIFWPRS